MVKLFVELLEFMRSCAPLFFSLGALILFFSLLSKSIKKHSIIYYTVFSIPFLLYLIPFLCRMMGIETFNVITVPVIGEILRDYIHVGAFAHPILIIIMYVGALSPKNATVRKLLSIRKEISIISGFPILTHSLVRVMGNLPNSLKYFTNNTEYMETAVYTNALGLGISNFSFVFGIILLILFIPLWVTSFDSVRKSMGGAKWKKLQRWSYVLYACLFIHAMGIQIGGILNPRGGAPRSNPNTEVAASVAQAQSQGAENARPAADSSVRDSIETPVNEAVRSSSGERAEGRSSGQRTARQQLPAGRAPTKGISDIEVSRQTKQYIHLFSLILIYGSYLYLRLRKARKDKERKSGV